MSKEIQPGDTVTIDYHGIGKMQAVVLGQSPASRVWEVAIVPNSQQTPDSEVDLEWGTFTIITRARLSRLQQQGGPE